MHKKPNVDNVEKSERGKAFAGVLRIGLDELLDALEAHLDPYDPECMQQNVVQSKERQLKEIDNLAEAWRRTPTTMRSSYIVSTDGKSVIRGARVTQTELAPRLFSVFVQTLLADISTAIKIPFVPQILAAGIVKVDPSPSVVTVGDLVAHVTAVVPFGVLARKGNINWDRDSGKILSWCWAAIAFTEELKINVCDVHAENIAVPFMFKESALRVLLLFDNEVFLLHMPTSWPSLFDFDRGNAETFIPTPPIPGERSMPQIQSPREFRRGYDVLSLAVTLVSPAFQKALFPGAKTEHSVDINTANHLLSLFGAPEPKKRMTPSECLNALLATGRLGVYDPDDPADRKREEAEKKNKKKPIIHIRPAADWKLWDKLQVSARGALRLLAKTYVTRNKADSPCLRFVDTKEATAFVEIVNKLPTQIIPMKILRTIDYTILQKKYTKPDFSLFQFIKVLG